MGRCYPVVVVYKYEIYGVQIVTSSLSCIPNTALSDFTIQGGCIDLVRFYIGIMIPNVITDLALLMLPIPYIWRLHVTISQKALVAGAFIMGGLWVSSKTQVTQYIGLRGRSLHSRTCVISIVRLAFIVNLNISDLTLWYDQLGYVHRAWDILVCYSENIANPWFPSTFKDNTSFCSWFSLSYSAIICTCLPSLRPLLHILIDKPLSRILKFSGRITFSSSKNSRSFWSGKSRRSGATNVDARSFTYLHDELRDQTQWGPTTSTHAAYGMKKCDAESELELKNKAANRINVTTDVAWHSGAVSEDV